MLPISSESTFSKFSWWEGMMEGGRICLSTVLEMVYTLYTPVFFMLTDVPTLWVQSTSTVLLTETIH